MSGKGRPYQHSNVSAGTRSRHSDGGDTGRVELGAERSVLPGSALVAGLACAGSCGATAADGKLGADEEAGRSGSRHDQAAKTTTNAAPAAIPNLYCICSAPLGPISEVGQITRAVRSLPTICPARRVEICALRHPRKWEGGKVGRCRPLSHIPTFPPSHIPAFARGRDRRRRQVSAQTEAACPVHRRETRHRLLTGWVPRPAPYAWPVQGRPPEDRISQCSGQAVGAASTGRESYMAFFLLVFLAFFLAAFLVAFLVAFFFTTFFFAMAQTSQKRTEQKHSRHIGRLYAAVFEPDAHAFADARLLHGHAVQHVGARHGALAVRYDHKLRMRQEAL